ncbi:2Fe-2S iron-sulfur cluster-binding protein [Sandaracinobacteroides saxicola]|uniref:(2Fe-2S)-binding protein n=1 Tax=Sandaracinobacteroides saxicola TaxID=2759707 RepID=A0A7G5II77_9SPHN|nr:2Fe-2S iron-sulfur cluster-binding protein [Sandaracinobacteroides saxicola]QMW23069.1 (2Fe-2S)-binding protein [Sandaracinobacteroides saxicola]
MRVSAGGARIDRGRVLRFRFDGVAMTGHPGDTLASALLANGVHLVGRSFKYHRPRGIVSAGAEEPNALVTVGEGAFAEPNTRATMVELHEGLVATSQNRWPSLSFDAGALTGLFGRFFPAGFYYKTFFGPASRWTGLYEPFIRRMAGLGPAPTAADPDHYDRVVAHCDCLVIGGGAAGRAAAAAASGRVMMLDEGMPGADPPGVTCLWRTTAFGRYDDNLVMAVERVADHLPPDERRGPRQRLWQIRAKEIVLATGAHQQPLVFPGNDLPGVMLESAAVRYLNDFGVLVGRRIVVAGEIGGADALRDAGAEVVHLPHVLAAHGGRRVRGVTGPDGRRIACDALLMGGHWQPAVHLFTHVGGKVAFDAGRHAFLPVAAEGQPRCVGACAGELPVVAPVAPVVGPKAFVDYQNDVTLADIDLAAREGFVSVEHLKRYTTTGMATDQGKLSNLNALSRLADNLAVAPGVVGTTTFRPPYTPVTFGALAGHDRELLIDPARTTPLHGWHVARGAVFEDVGQWKRPWYFPKAGESMHEAVLREGRAVREGVGMLDASTLGKIDIRGPDAAALLNLVYTNAWAKLEVGRCRYGVMLGEDGMVFDDGVSARIADDHFIMFTTTGNAARVLDRLEDYCQTEWPHLEVWLNSVTEHWAAAVVTGPRARDLLKGAVSGCDLSAEAFPHLAWREAVVAGHPVRLYRISFTGELSFEIHSDARHAVAVWQALWAAGEALGVTAYGTETMHVLRAEKGYVIIGQETDGTVGPHDLGLGWAVSLKKPDFIGKRSLARPDMQRPDRKQLVGLLPDAAVPEGAQLTAGAADRAMLGHVTSAYHSPVMDRPFALALLSGGRARVGEEVFARFGGAPVRCTVTEAMFHDPEGVRMNG